MRQYRVLWKTIGGKHGAMTVFGPVEAVTEFARISSDPKTDWCRVEALGETTHAYQRGGSTIMLTATVAIAVLILLYVAMEWAIGR